MNFTMDKNTHDAICAVAMMAFCIVFAYLLFRDKRD